MPTTYLEAIREGLWEEMERDPAVFCIGEDIAEYGGAFKVTAGFLERFGARRVVDTPISEAGIVGAAIAGAPPFLWSSALLPAAAFTADRFIRRTPRCGSFARPA